MANTAIATVDDVIARINARFATEKPAGGFADATSYAATKATVDAATDASTASTVVKRDANGDAGFRYVSASGLFPAAGHLVRKDWVDTQIATRVAVSLVGANNGVATLDSAGKIPTSQLPPLAINDVFTAASQAAMLALTAQIGDMARRTDFTPNRMYVLTTNSPTTLADWVEINAAGSVTSVDGQTGTVSLGSAGLGASTLARRTSTGQLIAADATGATELTTKGQIDSALLVFARDRGSAAAWPSTDLRRGDVAFHTGVGEVGVYSGTRWVLEGMGTVATIALRDAIAWAYEGLLIKVTATSIVYRYSGSRWDLFSAPATLLSIASPFGNFATAGQFQGLRCWGTDRTGHLQGFLQATAAIASGDFTIATVPDAALMPRSGSTFATGKVSQHTHFGGQTPPTRIDVNTNGAIVVSTPGGVSGSLLSINMMWPLD